MSKEKYLFLGSIKKTYGVAGALLIQTAGHNFRFKKSWEAVFIKIDGILVPFFLESRDQPDADTLILKIDQLNDKDSASVFVHRETYISRNDLLSREEDFGGSMLEGYTVIDAAAGELGVIRQFVDVKANPLFFIASGKKEFYVPASPDLITRTDTRNKIIYMHLPEGLVDRQEPGK